MADPSELTLRYRLLLAAYSWRVIDPVAWAGLKIPLSKARVALLTSAGLYRPGLDPPFLKSRGGDPSVRWFGADTALESLAIGQTSDAFDRSAIEQDRNEALPVERFHEFVREGLVGSLNSRLMSFNGSMTAPGRFVAETAPRVAEQLVQDGVDAALLVPV